MKQILLFLLMLTCTWTTVQAQQVYEDFESGTASLPWNGADGTYNGVIPNPGPDAVNPSSFVGSYTKSGAHSYSLFIAQDFGSKIDLNEYNQLRLKVWSATATPVLLKFEGPGQGIERTAEMTEAGAWNELVFDFSGGEALNNLTKVIIFFDPGVEASAHTYYFDDLIAYRDQECIETFDDGPALIWAGLDGIYEGIVDNPDPNFVNPSPFVAKYTKSGAHAYSLLLGESDTPFDLSVYNQFKLHLYATAATQVLMKIEGPGFGLEKVVNIAVANVWQEYTFDFSSASNITVANKIILFFDPGVETSADVYYFDNICATSQGDCEGVEKDPTVIDDFDCNRNATYATGWDSLSVVVNPYPGPDNSSTRVGLVNDRTGDGTEYYPLVIDYNAPLNLTENNQFSVQMYTEQEGTLLLKIEGGIGGAKEVAFDMVPNAWTTYTMDVSDQAGKGHNKFVIFFNAGVNGEEGDIYYIDNMTLRPKVDELIEDFEDGLSLGWQPFDQNEIIHGTFDAPVLNPAPGGVNSTDSVGCYNKGLSPFSTLQAFSLESFDLSENPQFNLDVLSPAGGVEVTMQLNSASQGNKEASANVTAPGTWETLSFDFSAFEDIDDFAEIKLIFNPNVEAQGERWCIDNLGQSGTTVDPCVDVVPDINIIDDFECQRNHLAIFYGASDLTVINNPNITAENSSLKVGQYADPAGMAFAGIGYEFTSPPDLSVFNILQVQIWSENANIPVLFKLEGGSPQVEIWDTIRTAGAWYKFNVDFSAHMGTNNTKLIMFINAGSDNGGTYLVDNVRWARAGINGCAVDFETPATTVDNFQYFANGTLEATGYPFKVVNNPSPSGINLSSKVGEFVKAGDALPFAGMYANLDAAIDFKGVKTAKAKVLMDHIGNFAIKLEGDAINNFVIELPIPNTIENEWEELNYDFATVPDNSEFTRLTLFFDLPIDATGVDVTSYFDDIVFGEGECGTNGLVFKPIPLEKIAVAPNPVSDMLQVDLFDNIDFIEIYNMLGVRVASVRTTNEIKKFIDVSRLSPGMFSMIGFQRDGKAIGMAKFVKE